MAKLGRLVNANTGEELLGQVRWCASFMRKLRGLMFRSHLEAGEGLLMVEAAPSRLGTGIHMLFMAFPIATIWMDADFQVVDTVLAKPWRPSYLPARAAKYTLEADPALLQRVSPGDRLRFEPQNA